MAVATGVEYGVGTGAVGVAITVTVTGLGVEIGGGGMDIVTVTTAAGTSGGGMPFSLEAGSQAASGEDARKGLKDRTDKPTSKT